MTWPDNPQDSEMTAQIDFSQGTRGGGCSSKTAATLRLPVYLEAEVQACLSTRATAKGIALDQLVNELLKKDIELIEVAK